MIYFFFSIVKIYHHVLICAQPAAIPTGISLLFSITYGYCTPVLRATATLPRFLFQELASPLCARWLSPCRKSW